MLVQRKADLSSSIMNVALMHMYTAGSVNKHCSHWCWDVHFPGLVKLHPRQRWGEKSSKNEKDRGARGVDILPNVTKSHYLVHVSNTLCIFRPLWPQGIKQPEFFGFICREKTSASSYMCYVFKCQSEPVVSTSTKFSSFFCWQIPKYM